jgi:transposase-like protein
VYVKTSKKLVGRRKREIVLFSDEHGVSEASREYGVSTVSIYKWKDKFQQLGKEGLTTRLSTAMERELKELRLENQALKRIVADKELALQVKDTILKKVNFKRNENHGGI